MLTSNPQISIIVPIFNGEKFLRQCLDSILNQLFKDFELLLIDDGSSDNSGEICDEYAERDKRIQVIHQVNKGSSAARQAGFDRARGEYIVAVDADDWVDPNYLDEFVKIAKDEDADIVISDYYINKIDEQVFVHQQPSAFDRKTLICEVLYGKYHAGLWCKILKRSLWVNNTIPQTPYNYYEDMFIYVASLLYAKKIAYSPKATYHYRYNEQSMTHDREVSKRILMFVQCMKNLIAIQDISQYGNDDDFIKALYHRVNHEKAQLLGNASHYSTKKPYLMKYFPESPSIIKINDFRSWGLKNALNGKILPYLIFKFFHFSGRKIEEIFKKRK